MFHCDQPGQSFWNTYTLAWHVLCHKIFNTMKHQKLLIGRRDKADFPDLELSEIEVKVDTGAHTSSIHCHDIETFMSDGVKRVRFKLLDPEHPAYNHKDFDLPVFKSKFVKSSNGVKEYRYIIKTRILIAKKPFPIELSLTDRSEMKYPVLLGRRALAGRFVVDVSLLNFHFKQRTSPSL